MSENPADFIGGAAQIVDYYGYWATFHDAGLVSLCIVPDEESITATFEYGDLTPDEHSSGLSKITLQWENVVSYALTADYAHDDVNTLYEMTFTHKDNLIETDIVRIYGMNGKIISRRVRVSDFKILP